jgi:hypothetical protein
MTTRFPYLYLHNDDLIAFGAFYYYTSKTGSAKLFVGGGEQFEFMYANMKQRKHAVHEMKMMVVPPLTYKFDDVHDVTEWNESCGTLKGRIVDGDASTSKTTVVSISMFLVRNMDDVMSSTFFEVMLSPSYGVLKLDEIKMSTQRLHSPPTGLNMTREILSSLLEKEFALFIKESRPMVGLKFNHLMYDAGLHLNDLIEHICVEKHKKNPVGFMKLLQYYPLLYQFQETVWKKQCQQRQRQQTQQQQQQQQHEQTRHNNSSSSNKADEEGTNTIETITGPIAKPVFDGWVEILHSIHDNPDLINIMVSCMAQPTAFS